LSFHVHLLAPWRIERLFARGADPSLYRAALRSAAQCPACAARFRRLWTAEAALCGDPDSPSPFALERVGAAVLERCAPPASASPAPRARQRWMVAAAATAAAAAVLLLVARAPSERTPLGPSARLAPVELVARAAPGAAHPEVGIRLFRASEGGAKVRESRALALADILTATYTNAQPGRRFLAIVGVQQDGRVKWYYPADPSTGGVALLEDVVDEPLGDGIRLSVRHSPGWLRVTALFSPKPLAAPEVERAIAAIASRPDDLPRLVPLSIPGAVEHSLRVEISR
jgi:hypothetical protein